MCWEPIEKSVFFPRFLFSLNRSTPDTLCVNIHIYIYCTIHCSSIEISLPKLPGAHTMHHVFACVCIGFFAAALSSCYYVTSRCEPQFELHPTTQSGADRTDVWPLYTHTHTHTAHSHTHVGGSGDLLTKRCIIVFIANAVLIEIGFFFFENRPAATRRAPKSRPPTHSAAAETRRLRLIYYSAAAAAAANSPERIYTRHTYYTSQYII